MAIQTKIDGGKQAITFYKDTEPCAVYVDGELQQDVSFVPSELVQGTGSISYTSEYKKNQLNMEIQGTTYQYSHEGNITETQSLTPYASFVEDYTMSSYGRILRSVQPISLPDTTQDLYFSLIDYESIASQIPLYETLFLINEERTELYNLYAGGNAQFTQVPSNDTYYLGIADEEDAGNDNERCYNLFVQNAKLQVEYNVNTPTPQLPSPIENANNNGMTVTVHGKNLLDIGTQETVAEYWGNRASALTITNTGVSAKVLEYKAMWSNYIKRRFNTGTYTVSCKSDYDWRFLVFPYDTDGNRITTKPSGGNMGSFSWVSGGGYDCWTSNRPASSSRLTFTIPDSVASFEIGFGWIDKYDSAGATGAGVGTTYEISEMQLEVGNITNPVYVPYYGEELVIPTRLEASNGNILQSGTALADGKKISLLMTKFDKLIIDRNNNKVNYVLGSLYHEFKGDEYMTYASANGYNFYVCSLGTRVNWVGASADIRGNGFCNYLRPGNYYDLSTLYGFCGVNRYTNGVPGENYIGLWTDRQTSLADFRIWLRQKYNEGKPLIIVIKRDKALDYDITNTDLGQSLINLATENNINYIEVQGNGKAPAIPIKTTYAKWGGNIDNNNNT